MTARLSGTGWSLEPSAAAHFRRPATASSTHALPQLTGISLICGALQPVLQRSQGIGRPDLHHDVAGAHRGKCGCLTQLAATGRTPANLPAGRARKRARDEHKFLPTLQHESSCADLRSSGGRGCASGANRNSQSSAGYCIGSRRVRIETSPDLLRRRRFRVQHGRHRR
jgi:hypothetical protein